MSDILTQLKLQQLKLNTTLLFLIFSAINPMLYSLMSTKFRRAFRRMLSCNRAPLYEPRGEVTCAMPSVAHAQTNSARARLERLNNVNGDYNNHDRLVKNGKVTFTKNEAGLN